MPSWNARAAARSLVTIASECPEPYRLTWSIASSTESTTRTARISARNSSAQSDSRRDRHGRIDRTHPLVAAQLDARARAAPPTRAAGTSAATDGVHEQRLGRVAHARALDLGVDDDPLGHREIGASRPRRRGSCPPRRRSPGTRATALIAFFRPSPPRGMIRSTTPSSCASSVSSSRPPPATSASAPAGSPAPSAASRAIRASTALECAADDDPRSSTALPDFRHSAAASIVTFGRAS